jgi:hypothetical protein
MKKILLIAALASAVLGLSATASHALEPGCSDQFMPLLQHQADAMRARNRAYEREIINREESTLYLTCFDQAMALSARLGYIFSDNVPADPPPANTFVFTAPLAFPDWGAQQLLALDLNDVITPVLDNEMLNFLPPWVTPNSLTVLANQLKPTIAAIKAFQTNEAVAGGLLDQYIKLVKQIDKLVGTFVSVSSAKLPGLMNQYLALTKQLDTLVKNIIKARDNALTPLLAKLKSTVFAANMNCTRLDDLWNKDNHTTSEYYPPEGAYFPMTPYYSLKDFLTPNPPGATPVFLSELATATDAPILQTALGDLTNLLDAPGQLPQNLWPLPPTITPGMSTLQIIQQM